MMDAIACRDLLFGYDSKPVLRNVNITIPEGDFVCVVGPNGSGKTTLLKIALGLLKPTAGTIEVFGQPPDRSRGRIGYVPQHPRLDPLFPVSAMDVVLMGRLGRTRAFGDQSGKTAQRPGRAPHLHWTCGIDGSGVRYHLRGAPYVAAGVPEPRSAAGTIVDSL